MAEEKHLNSTNLHANLLACSNLEDLRKSFIETLTHDLKTPVLAQIRALELMLNKQFGEFNKEQAEILQLTLDSCKYMYEMVSTLISTYRFELEEFELNYLNFNIINMIEDCIKNLQNYLSEKNIKIAIIPNIKTSVIAGDEIRLEKVIQTLLSTSVYSAIKNSTIKVFITENNNTVSLRIESQSEDISQDKINKMFQFNTPHIEKFDKIGTGIGLFLTKKIIEKHNGKMIVQSNIERNVVIGFEIPVRIPKEIQHENYI